MPTIKTVYPGKTVLIVVLLATKGALAERGGVRSVDTARGLRSFMGKIQPRGGVVSWKKTPTEWIWAKGRGSGIWTCSGGTAEGTGQVQLGGRESRNGALKVFQ